ncbi:hypothetical protein [Companilactobacillus nuruki]|uniref:Surface layer protein A domain-containing protein n=1 Tax=Companilactobacillus nuruki TaxID=1993540 RepID=A0A2N7AV09_9LACO|nr:hypothetical protein [Companilactobacillus nuruki]PMD71432.1 hypothetical protein CBP76_05485 [Companilactobacillus nuruki]
MKKSIKYAGIAAATLLTVAPIAAPVVSNVTTVKADSSDAQTDASTINNAVSNFQDLYSDKDASTVTDVSDIDLGNDVDFAKFNTSATNKSLTTKTLSSEDVTTLSNPDRDAKVNVTAATSKGSITKTADLQTILKDNDYPAVTFTITLNYKDINGNRQTKTATVVAKRTDQSDITTLKATYSTPLNVALNSKTTTSQLISAANVSIKDQNNDDITSGDVEPTSNYYYTYSAAMANDDSKTVQNLDGTDVINSKNEFVKAGTYYQAITVNVTADSALATYLKDYNSDPTSNPVYINGKLASKGYDFSLDSDTAPTKITFVRTINVATSTSDWTVEQNKGIVTTKSDKDSYTLKNDDNETISDRALAKNSAWVTDQKRTDQNGNVQYRVATGEWIPAENVTFSDKTADTGYTDVKALNGKVATAGPAGYYYPLFDDNGKQISNRGVSGLTEWYTDKSAVNADGVTVYHVATGEWLQGTNVTYTAY